MSLFKHFAPGKVELFVKRRLSLTPPIYFNDDFEFAPPITPPTQEGLTEQFEQFVREEYDKSEFKGRLPFAEFRRQRETVRGEFLQSVGSENFQAGTSDYLRKGLSKLFGGICFTEVPDNKAMWAHYSDSFGGFVGEFQAGEPFNEKSLIAREMKIGLAIKVTYASKFPILLPNSENAAECFCSKHTHWAYEQEWRVIRPLTDGQSFDGTPHVFIIFPPESLKRIICGHKMSHEHKKALQEMLKAPDMAHVALETTFLDFQSQTVQFRNLE
jgi:hypothetical protein